MLSMYGNSTVHKNLINESRERKVFQIRDILPPQKYNDLE